MQLVDRHFHGGLIHFGAHAWELGAGRARVGCWCCSGGGVGQDTVRPTLGLEGDWRLPSRPRAKADLKGNDWRGATEYVTNSRISGQSNPDSEIFRLLLLYIGGAGCVTWRQEPCK